MISRQKAAPPLPQVFFVVALLAVLVKSTFSAPTTVSWISTTEQKPWVNQGALPLIDWDEDTTRYIAIDSSVTFQQIDGWGGALNEKGWVALSVLPEAERATVLQAIFGASGCAFNMSRMCIGANDYSLTMYSCDETPDDYTMANFSLAKDKVNVIPFALAAKAINPAMLFWGSPHSPPAWMKQNNNLIDGSLKTDVATRKAYALYFQKWIEGMGAEGVPISNVHIQNEPNISGVGYPTCLMSGAEMGTLIKEYLGPQLRDNGLATEIWVGTLHSTAPNFTSFYPEYIPPTLGDPTANPFIAGVGMQWNALGYAHLITENFPAVKMWQTETQCGNFFWSAEYNAVTPPNDWAYGVFTFQRMLMWLRAGTNAYFQWNIVLDEQGMSNSITNPWPQNSMITINKTSGAVTYNPQFYAVQHMSHFVKPGAMRIATTGNYNQGGSILLSANLEENVTSGDMMAFRNPNGTVVLVARNTADTDMPVAVKFGSLKFKPTIPAHSINTFYIADPSATGDKRSSPKHASGVSIRPSAHTVAFMVPATSGRTITCLILDAHGRAMSTIRQSAQHGTASVLWNRTTAAGNKAAPGVYFAKITSDDNAQMLRFTLH